MQRIIMCRNALAATSGERDVVRTKREHAEMKVRRHVKKEQIGTVYKPLPVRVGVTYAVGISDEDEVKVKEADANELVRLGMAYDPDDPRHINVVPPPMEQKGTAADGLVTILGA